MTDQSRREQLNADILECISELIGRVVRHGEQLAQNLGIPAPFIKALHIMDGPMAMKELGKRMHCDPSFVTLVADMLEKRGLARREPHPADRRVKNIVLGDDGLRLKHQLETEIAARMPWNCLNDGERVQFLALLRKMLCAGSEPDSTPAHDTADASAFFAGAGLTPPGAMDQVLASGLGQPAAHPAPGSPPPTGEVSSAAGKPATG
jgi:MarR family transcriptional regulator, organic hydroperoxide resistance regulator